MRSPVVAGQFYPSDENELRSNIGEFIAEREEKPVKGAIVPHAGYMFSGRTAAQVYANLPKAETYIFIGPNHAGIGSAIAASNQNWRTPLGSVRVDEQFVDELPRRIIDFDEYAHTYEHSIEVQLPFLQFLFEDFKIVPICMGLQDEITAEETSSELLEAISRTKRDVIVIASSDFTHYEPDATAREVDHHVIQAILNLDIDGFYRILREKNASVCGYGPIAVMMHVMDESGVRNTELVDYKTSGDIIGDRSRVVGYAGIIFYE